MKRQEIAIEELELHSMELENHPMMWLFQNEIGVNLSEEQKDQIIALNKNAAKFLWEYEGKMGLWKFYPNIEKYFKEVKTETKFKFNSNHEKELKKWLFNLGISFDTKIFISFSPNAAFILTWKMIIKYCSTIFFAHDLVIYDKTLNWGLYFHHDDIFHFGKNRIYNAKIEGEKVLRDAKLISDWKNKIEANKTN